MGLMWIWHTLRACVRVHVYLYLCDCVSKGDKEPEMDIDVRKLGRENSERAREGDQKRDSG